MRKLLLAAGTMMIAGPAMAADFYVPPPVYVPPPAPVYYNWTGPYVGVQKGWSWANYAAVNGGPQTYNANGFVAGIFAGYNWALAPSWVFGLEADINWSNVLATNPAFPGHSIDENYFGTVRARLGYAWNNTLLYVAGGYAYANDTFAFTPNSASRTHGGWTAGVGIDHAFTPNVFGRIEYRYTAYNTQTYPIVPNHTLNYTDSKVLFGLALKF